MKKLLAIIFTTALFCLPLGGCNVQEPPAPESSAPTQPSNPISDEEWSVSAELVEIHEKDGILRVECIQPGLDTYSLTVTLRSLTEGKDLATVELGEDAWETGWTNDGFYAISLLKKIAYLYDKGGKCVKEITLPGEIQSLSLAILNENTDMALLGKGETAELLLYDVKGGTQKAVGALSGSTRTLTYENGCFYLSKTDTGELLRIEENAEWPTVPYCHRGITFMSPYMGIGTTESNFSIYKAGTDTAVYVPFRAVDEIPLAASETAFLTVSSVGDEDILYLYDLQAKAVGTLSVPAHAVAAEYTDGGTWMVTTNTDGEYSVNVYESSRFTVADLAVSAQDTIPTATMPPQTEDDAQPNGKRILSVPVLNQWPEYPTGCESVSAVMALRYAGEDVSVAEFVDTYLPKSSEFYFQGGVKYGPDPYEVFIGSPRTSAAYGCMAPVIEKALTAFFGSAQRVHNTTGASLTELCADYIDKGTPVLVWATISMLDTYPSATWYLADGSRFNWPANEHCMVLVGYDDGHYYFNDPYKGKVIAYDKALSNNRHEILGKQSVVIL